MISLTTLFSVETATRFLETALELARIVGLPVETWRTADPTKTVLKHQAEIFATGEEVKSQFIKSGFISTAEGDWKTLHAKEFFNIEREEASYASPTVTFDNAGGG